MNKDLLLCKAKTVKGKWVIGTVARMPSHYAINRELYNVDGEFSSIAPIGIDPETICRCTGKQDSKGNLIFDGDWFYEKSTGMKVLIGWNDLKCEFVGVIHYGDESTEELNIDEWQLLDETIEGNRYDVER